MALAITFTFASVALALGTGPKLVSSLEDVTVPCLCEGLEWDCTILRDLYALNPRSPAFASWCGMGSGAASSSDPCTWAPSSDSDVFLGCVPIARHSPNSTHKQQRLSVLRVRGQALEGRIPASLGRLIWLKEVDLSKNKFTGAVPGFLSNLGELTKLALESNSLTSPQPGFCDLFNGQDLDCDLSGNQFDHLPEGCGRCKVGASPNSSKPPIVLLSITIGAVAVGGLMVAICILWWAQRQKARRIGPSDGAYLVPQSKTDTYGSGTSTVTGRSSSVAGPSSSTVFSSRDLSAEAVCSPRLGSGSHKPHDFRTLKDYNLQNKLQAEHVFSNV